MRFRRNQPEPAPVRLVRLHTVAPGTVPAELTIEGYLVAVELGHYVLERPRIMEGSTVAHTPDVGTRYEVPVERVWFREVLAEDARL